ncbi:tripartite tricarboxylate transporter substrate binding protein [Tardiphaga sp.]|uniref:Bug family tripartite tricarboxylate transporter substrate binding protein n=1 Tax=Tardiphaga sp. TaxID=1926292 RepID=UPI002639804F|nr:tripartite tricarboxylate transporter substrate binding protein [Tardiphaga sp.]MDB5616490.1 tripartite tricarboxylate transporter family receptor [Tardiphaga sp.]
MTSRLTRRTFCNSLALAPAGLATPLRAQGSGDLPKGLITLVVPFAAGGATDVVSRIVARKLSEQIGQSIVIENVTGAGGVVGAARVARAAPDGTSLLMGTISTHTINPLMAKQPPYDPIKDFTAISMVATVPNVLLVSSRVKAANVGELIALIRADPGSFSYGSSGIGTPPNLSGELFNVQAKVKMGHVPYRGGAPAMNDLIGGQIPVLFDVLSGAAPFIKAGTARALAVTTKTRSPSFPDLPTIAEQGLPEFETYTWNAVFGPPGLPANMAERLSAELRKAVADPEIQQRLRDLSADPVGSTPAELANQLQQEITKWQPVIETAGLKIQ